MSLLVAAFAAACAGYESTPTLNLESGDTAAPTPPSAPGSCDGSGCDWTLGG